MEPEGMRTGKLSAVGYDVHHGDRLWRDPEQPNAPVRAPIPKQARLRKGAYLDERDL